MPNFPQYPMVMDSLVQVEYEKPVGDVIQAVYGWTDAWEKLRLGHEAMPAFYRLAGREDELILAAVGILGGLKAVLAYRGRPDALPDLSGF